MTFTRLFQGADSTSSGVGQAVDRLFFTKAAEPQAFRHPLLTHLQHSLYSQLDGGGGSAGSAIAADVTAHGTG